MKSGRIQPAGSESHDSPRDTAANLQRRVTRASFLLPPLLRLALADDVGSMMAAARPGR